MVDPIFVNCFRWGMVRKFGFHSFCRRLVIAHIAMSTTAFTVEKCSGKDKCLALRLLILFLLAKLFIGSQPNIKGLWELQFHRVMCVRAIFTEFAVCLQVGVWESQPLYFWTVKLHGAHNTLVNPHRVCIFSLDFFLSPLEIRPLFGHLLLVFILLFFEIK